MSYKDFFKMYEADRSRFINPNPNLTDKQKSELIEFFKKYTNIGSDIKWGSKEVSNWTYNNFLPYIEKASKTKSAAKKNGVSSLIEGKDYKLLDDNDEFTAYQPLNHFGSKILASNATFPPVMTPPPRWSNPDDWEGDTPIKPNAKWCISMNTSEWWDRYTSRHNYRFIFICFKNNNLEDKDKKIALVINHKGIMEDGFNAADDEIFSMETEEDYTYYNVKFKYLIPKMNDSTIVGKIIERYFVKNEETGRYDMKDRYRKQFDVEDIIISNEIGFPLGVWKGNFCIPQVYLESTNNFPTEVLGNYEFACNLPSLCTKSEDRVLIVHGDLRIEDDPYLTTLYGAPEVVEGDVKLLSLLDLKNLEGFPKEVKGCITISKCYNLESFKGICNKCEALEFTYLNSIKDGFNGFPSDSEVEDYIEINHMDFNDNFNGVPRCPAYYVYNSHGLRTLEGLPREVEDLCLEEASDLKSTKGCPEKINGLLTISNCYLLRDKSYIPKDALCDFKDDSGITFTDEELQKSKMDIDEYIKRRSGNKDINEDYDII